jgi:hypothetical protein
MCSAVTYTESGSSLKDKDRTAKDLRQKSRFSTGMALKNGRWQHILNPLVMISMLLSGAAVDCAYCATLADRVSDSVVETDPLPMFGHFWPSPVKTSQVGTMYGGFLFHGAT